MTGHCGPRTCCGRDCISAPGIRAASGKFSCMPDCQDQGRFRSPCGSSEAIGSRKCWNTWWTSDMPENSYEGHTEGMHFHPRPVGDSRQGHCKLDSDLYTCKHKARMAAHVRHRPGSTRSLNPLFCPAIFSMSCQVLGAATERFSRPFLVIRISSSMRTPIFHHFLSQGLPSGMYTPGSTVMTMLVRRSW